jgi:uncharacterized protein YeaO (DUF488 family)
MAGIQIKRAYDKPERSDGKRFLVDHLWPRGVTKAKLKADAWLKGLSPSEALRKWFAHDPQKWREFQRRYAAELNQHEEELQPLLNAAGEGQVTLLYGARDTEHNNAVVLKDYLEKAGVRVKRVSNKKRSRKTK